MSKEDRYFQFPLCALRYGSTLSERFSGIISYGYIEAGQSLWHKLPEEKQEEWKEYFKAERARKASGLAGGINFNCSWHYAALYGMHTLNISNGNLELAGRARDALSEHERTCLSGGTKDVEVRVTTSLVFEVRDGKGMSYPEFAVLCAIYSVIGSKKSPVKITLQTIGVRAYGYKSKAALDQDLNSLGVSKIGLEELTPKRLRNTVEKLHQLGFFARVTYGRRQTYYSHRMDEDEMRKKIFASKTFGSDFKTKKRLSDNDLTKATREQKARNEAKIKAGQPQVKHAGNRRATQGQL